MRGGLRERSRFDQWRTKESVSICQVRRGRETSQKEVSRSADKRLGKTSLEEVDGMNFDSGDWNRDK